MDLRPTLDAPDDDPYVWLEDIDGERALAWVDAATAATIRRFGGERVARDAATLAAIFDRKDKIAYVRRRGADAYNFWQDAEHPRGLWRRTPWSAYREGEPAWEILLDLDALARDESEDWVWAGAATLPGDRAHAILSLSRGGGDASVEREYDLDAKHFVADGFRLPEAKTSLCWIDANALFVTSALGEGMATRSGYARTIRLWRRGEPFESAVIVHEGVAEDISVSAGVDRSTGAPRWVFETSSGFFDSDLWIGDAKAQAHVPIPADAVKDVFKDWLIVKPRTPWTVGGRTFAVDSLIVTRLSLCLAGAPEFQVLFTPGERRTLGSFFFCGSKLVLGIFDDLKPSFETLTPTEGEWTRAPVPGLPELGVVDISRLDVDDADSNGEALVYVQDPLTPPELRVVQLDAAEIAAPALLSRMPALFDASGLETTRHEAISIDGERIPYFQVGPRVSDGGAFVHMTGYGGFAISEKPTYRSSIGKLWLERGGVGVVANIRGGGEFGTRWHDAGRGERKRLSHDDFAAVAADLVARGVTIPGRIAAEGGSNGGILISNMLTRYPEQFGALFCTIPLIDMRRYTKLLAGASWIDEYGDPDKPEQWAYLSGISAYHAAVPGKVYPPILIATSRRDDRVHPGHARKMAAKLQAMNYPAYFYEPAAGGHGYGKDNKERAAFIALGLNFLWETIGGPR